MAKGKKRTAVDPLKITAAELLLLLNAEHSYRTISEATGIDRGTISKLLDGKLSRTNEGNYRAILRYALSVGVTLKVDSKRIG